MLVGRYSISVSSFGRVAWLIVPFSFMLDLSKSKSVFWESYVYKLRVGELFLIEFFLAISFF